MILKESIELLILLLQGGTMLSLASPLGGKGTGFVGEQSDPRIQ